MFKKLLLDIRDAIGVKVPLYVAFGVRGRVKIVIRITVKVRVNIT